MRCSIHHHAELVWEEGGITQPTVHGRWYCPDCQDEFLVIMASEAMSAPKEITVQGKTYRLSMEPIRGCWCVECEVKFLRDKYGDEWLFHRRMVVCPECGNKRCPRATHHDNACTGSNEPGQPGSRYGGLREET